MSRVLNSVAAGRRLAQRTVALQVAVTLATALVCLLSGRDAALGALAGGLAMSLGNLVAAWTAFAGGVSGAAVALGRLLAATALKWLVVAGGLYLALAIWQLPALPVLAAAALAAAAFLIAAKLWT
jgi:F0F1-type ATP synthase assembly protein I